MFDKVLKFPKKVKNGICPIKKVDNTISPKKAFSSASQLYNGRASQPYQQKNHSNKISDQHKVYSNQCLSAVHPFLHIITFKYKPMSHNLLLFL